MDNNKINELEFNILKMLLENSNNYKDTVEGIEVEIYNDNIYVNLEFIPYNDPFKGLKVFESKRISKSKFEFRILNDYRNFDSQRLIKSSILYHMLYEYDMDNIIKIIVILFSNFSNNRINQLMKNLKSEVNIEIKKFFRESKQIFLEEN